MPTKNTGSWKTLKDSELEISFFIAPLTARAREMYGTRQAHQIPCLATFRQEVGQPTWPRTTRRCRETSELRSSLASQPTE